MKREIQQNKILNRKCIISIYETFFFRRYKDIFMTPFLFTVIMTKKSFSEENKIKTKKQNKTSLENAV